MQNLKTRASLRKYSVCAFFSVKFVTGFPCRSDLKTSKFTKKCMASGRRVGQRPDCHTFLCKFWHFQMAVSQWKLAWLTPNLGILWISVCSFWLCESIIANPIIYRLVPGPSRFETRQLHVLFCCTKDCELGKTLKKHVQFVAFYWFPLAKIVIFIFIFTALVRMDKNDSRIPVLFSLTSSCAATFAAFKGKVLEACGLSLKNVQFFYLHKDLKVQLRGTTWAAFVHFLKGCTNYTVSLELETVLCQAKLVLPFSRKSQAKAFLQPRCHQGFLVNHKIKAIQCWKR